MTAPLDNSIAAQILSRLDKMDGRLERVETVLNGDGTVGGKEGVVSAVNQINKQMAEVAEFRNAPWRMVYSTASHVITAIVTALVIAAIFSPGRAAMVPKPMTGGPSHVR